MTFPVRRIAWPVLAVALVAPLSACASDSLQERDARSVRSGQVIAPSYTAAVRGKQVHVMLPSGRVDLTLTEPVDEIAAQDNARATALRPADGAVAVGVSWSLNRGGLPDSPNRQLTEPKTIFGVPQPVRLRLVADGVRHDIPDVGTLELPGPRARNAAWVVVPSGVRQWRFEVGFAGVTQTVDVRSGRVTPGLAAPLYRPLPLDRGGECRIETESYANCSVRYAVGYPYVDGVGWAPKGKVFALLRFSVYGKFDNGEVRVAGTRRVGSVSDRVETFAVYAVTPARTYALRGTGPAEDDSGRPAAAPLTGTLTPGSSA